MVVSPAAAATITVNTTATAPANDGKCGIFEAAIAANFNSAQDACAAGAAGADTIKFSLPTPATLNLAAGGFGALPVGPPNEPLTVIGPTANASDLTLDGGGTTGIFDTSSNLTLRKITLTRGSVTDGDGAGVNAGPDVTVTLMSARFTSNFIHASGGGSGPGGHGACVSAPKITDTNSTFVGNAAAGDGGCLFATQSLSVSGSTFNGNLTGFAGGLPRNGAALATGGNASAVTVNRSTFDHNDAGPGHGGGIWIGGATVLNVSRTTFSNHRASQGGAIFSDSLVGSTISQSTFTGNGAGGFTDEGGALDVVAGGLTVSDSTFSNNFVNQDGGAINVRSDHGPSNLLATDNTFDRNGAFSRGAAIAKDCCASTVRLADSTVSRPFGPSILSSLGGDPFFLDRSIVADPQGVACDGPFIHDNYNDIYAPGAGQQGSCVGGSTNLNSDPMLSDPGSFGGPTLTELPGPGTAVVDAIPSANCPSGPPTPLDQRGVARPVAARCDIGAVEMDSKPDGEIGISGGAYVGDGVHNKTGAGQTRTATVARGSSIIFYVRAQNDAQLLRERLRMRGPGGNQNFQVKYTDADTNDITSAVTGKGYLTASLDPGKLERIRVKVNVLSGAPAGASITLPVTVDSTRVPSRRDKVVAVVNAG